MKQAYLIIAHNEWEILNILLRRLDYPENDVYLHIDKRVTELPKLHQFENAGFHLLEKRNAVTWGDFSQVETELLLFKEAHKNGPYFMYHLLSGVDLPIKSHEKIYSFFQEHKDNNFIGIRHSAWDCEELKERWSYHYLFMRYNKRNTADKSNPMLKLCLTLIRHSIVKIEKLLKIRRNTDIELIKTHQWCSLTQQGIELILSKEDEIAKRFKQTLCPDEIFIGTLLWNSPLRNTIYNTTDDRTGCMRNIDWQRGAPYNWQPEDIDELESSPYMFARKISPGLAKLLK